MAIVTASTNCGLSASFTAVTANQSNVIVFMAFKPVGNVTTWGRQVGLMKSGSNLNQAVLRLRGDNAFEGYGYNQGSAIQQVFFSSASAGSWKRIAYRLRYADRSYGRASGDGSLSQSGLNDMGYWPGVNGVDMFRVNANHDASTYGESASYAHFGCYFGDWTDQEIADFCAGTWNPANNSKVTHYWDGSSKTAQVGGLTLTDLGSNNATVEADTGHGVPDYSNGAMSFSGGAAVSAVAAAGTATVSGTSRQFSMTLYQEDGVTPLAGRTNLWYAWWPSIAEARTAAASIYGTGASTNGSGQIAFAAPSGLSVGNNQGYGVISDQDATADAAEIAYVGSFDVI